MFEEVKAIIVDTLNCEADQVTLEANLFDDLGADSLDAMELNLALEEEFSDVYMKFKMHFKRQKYIKEVPVSLQNIDL